MIEFSREPAVPVFPRTRYLTTVCCLMLSLVLVPPRVVGAAGAELYTGEVPVADQGAAERDRAVPLALEQVLQKLSGLRQFEDYPLVQPALERAPALLLSYHYRNAEYLLADGSGESQLRLVARFSEPAVDEMARALQLPLWQPDRPPLTLWLVVDQGFERRIMPIEYVYVKQALDDVAERRGLPLRWPEPGPDGEYAVDLQLLWGGYTEELAADGNAGVLIAAARREGPEWSVRMNLDYQGRHQAFRLNDIDLQAALTTGLQDIVDQVATEDSIAAADLGNWSQELVVGGLNGPADYLRCLNYLQGISIVDQVDVVSARPGTVTFRLGLAALPDYLEQSLASGGILARVDPDGDYELMPEAPNDG